MASSSFSWSYDVFISFRGEDTRKTFVDHFYSALGQRQISAYKDDKAFPRGDSISPSLYKAIEQSQIAVIIFSENYADSSWCLEELAHIMKCKDENELIVMPIFYHVDPSDVRNQERKFGEAFAKQKVKNVTKVELWRKALVDATGNAGWEVKYTANGHESKAIKEIVDKICDRLFSLKSDVQEDHVGLTTRVQDLISLLDVEAGGVRVVGIWGIGGSGRTTLASCVYMEICQQFDGYCFIDNIRVKSLKYGLITLQEKLLTTILKTQVEVQHVLEGMRMISRRLSRSKVLILLDDVDHCDQLEALVGSRDWFGNGSRIIITSRNEHVLRTYKAEVIYSVGLLNHDEAIRLFKRFAYNEKEPIKDYEALSLHVISYAGGLPLALKVLGSFLYDKDEKEWRSTLARLKAIPEKEIFEQLKISYDGLRSVEKKLFLYIACFFRGENIDDAIEIFKARGYHPYIGIKVLQQKALITIVDGKFDMHDLVQEMGCHIVKRIYPNKPEKENRLWNYEEIDNMCLGCVITENGSIEATQYKHRLDGHSPLILYKIASYMKKLCCLM